MYRTLIFFYLIIILNIGLLFSSQENTTQVNLINLSWQQEKDKNANNWKDLLRVVSSKSNIKNIICDYLDCWISARLFLASSNPLDNLTREEINFLALSQNGTSLIASTSLTSKMLNTLSNSLIYDKSVHRLVTAHEGLRVTMPKSVQTFHVGAKEFIFSNDQEPILVKTWNTINNTTLTTKTNLPTNTIALKNDRNIISYFPNVIAYCSINKYFALSGFKTKNCYTDPNTYSFFKHKIYIEVWNEDFTQRILRKKIATCPYELSFSPDGKYLTVGQFDKILLINLSNNHYLEKYIKEYTKLNPVWGIIRGYISTQKEAFPTRNFKSNIFENTIFKAFREKSLNLYSHPTCQLFTYSHDGRYFAFCKDGGMCVFDFATNSYRADFEETWDSFQYKNLYAGIYNNRFYDYIPAMALSHNGKYLAYVIHYNTIIENQTKIYAVINILCLDEKDPQNNECVGMVYTKFKHIDRVCFSWDSNYLAFGSRDYIAIYDLNVPLDYENEFYVQKVQSNYSNPHFQFSKCGRYFYFVNGKNVFCLRNQAAELRT